jgi:ATP-dependent DNA helicase DinG
MTATLPAQTGTSTGACGCTPAWPALAVTIDGVDRPAISADEHTAAESATTQAPSCTGCGTAWPGHWTLAPITNPETVAQQNPPKTAVDLLRLLVAERPNGEVRPQQEAMVEAVERAIATKRHLVGQAGTGTGKTLSYLIPAIHAGERVVVSTATKQLGEQIVNEDLPVLNRLMPKVGGPDFSYALLKGRSNYACFGRGTEVMTYDGLRRIEDLAGSTAVLLDGDGNWTESPVQDFGVQRIVEVDVSRNGVHRTIRTTADHRWFVQKNANFEASEEVVTADLKPGMRLKYASARSLPTTGKGLRPSPFGVAHGFTFGDGTVFGPTVNGWRTGTVVLHGEKDKALIPFFNGCHQKTVTLSANHADDTAIRICDLPNRFKTVPDLDEAPSYLYGWLAGYFAADGSVAVNGTATLYSATREHIDFVMTLCARLGIQHGLVSEIKRASRFTRGEVTNMFSLSLSRATLTDDFFIIPAHRARAEAVREQSTYKQWRAARRWKVEAVRDTTDEEVVYCAVVPTTASFVLAGNILTGNCQAKIDRLVNLDAEDPDADSEIAQALFDVPEVVAARRPSKKDLDDLNALITWADSTQSGDRSEAPASSDKTWGQVSTDSAGCPGAKACPFGQTCFAERARRDAREADVVVTNHAQIAHDLPSDMPLLGDYDVLVADEVHELESFLSSAWGVEVSASAMKQQVALAARRLTRDKSGESAREAVKKVIEEFDALDEMLRREDAGLKPVLPESIVGLLASIARKLTDISTALDAASEAKGVTSQVAAERKGAAGTVLEAAEALVTALTTDENTVRWLEAAQERRGPVIKTAPLWIGDRLQRSLGSKTLIATSATITVGGKFDSMIRTLGLGQPVNLGGKTPAPARGFDTLDVGTPFDYEKQVIFYVPGGDFPEPVWANKAQHTVAARQEIAALMAAAGGRTLALFTTTTGAKDAAAELKARSSTPVLAQGEAPPSQLIREFADNEATSLFATRGMWHGVNVPGPSLTLTTIDALPFIHPKDPLASARRAAADAAGRDGYTEVYVANAAIALAQAFGRLVRTSTDRGVVALLDPRILTKRYGAVLRASLPTARVFRDRDLVVGALGRLAALADAAAQANGTASTASTATRRATPAPKPSQKVRRAAPSARHTRSIGRNVRGTTTGQDT